MKILLISPKCEYFSSVAMYFPLGLAYISSSLRKIKASIKFIDFEIETHSQEKLNLILENWKPDYIGFSIHYACLKNAVTLAKYIKQTSNKTMLVAGGVSPSIDPESFLKENLFDFVIRGDGEFPFTQLVQDVPRNEIPGLCYNDSVTGKAHISKTNDAPYHLENLPFPDYETIPFNNYRSRLGGNFYSPSYPIFSSRGCSNTCTFCTSYDYNKHHRTRDPNDVISEIQMAIKVYKAKEIRFLDATFSENRQHAYGICEKIINSNLSIPWGCSTRIDKLDKDLIGLMKRAGCISIAVGIESANPELLKKVKKIYDIEESVAILQHCKKLGIFIKGSFMYGLPGETKKTMKETLNYAMTTPTDFPVFNYFSLPMLLSLNFGTPIEKEYYDLQESNKENSLLPKVSPKYIKFHIFASYFLFYFRFVTIKKFLTKKVYFIFFMQNVVKVFPFIIFNATKYRIKRVLQILKGG